MTHATVPTPPPGAEGPAAAPVAIRDLPRFEQRPEGWSDHDFIAHWRAQGPAAVDRYGIVTLFGHDDLWRAVDPRFTRQVGLEAMTMQGRTGGAVYDFFDRSLLFANDARHRARRGPLARAFAHPLMNALRGEIAEQTRALLAPLKGREADFGAEVSGQLAARMIAAILGLPPEDIPHFTKVVYGASRGLSFRSKEVLDEADADMAELVAYAARLLEERRARPREDFLTEFLAKVQDADLSEDEIRTQVATVVLGGADTTRMALASGFAQILARPEQWAALQADPEGLKASAAAECLRFDPVVGSIPRLAIADFEIAGVAVPEGTYLAASLLGALRDPAVYARPEVFDIARDDHPRLHPVFGAGAHRCLGEALARAELEEALAVLAREAPEAELVGEPPVMRGLGGTRGLPETRIRL
ncbi:cytochrome P450 [uncultured Albimonas sp.]|uniref:cytochrome P450 n=1 Tax=uncultured Albimonas sp. TaxID=1331701 RepID=UPI0030ED5ED0|tara:strand:- start:521 stop:1771 length:1251 start_codon:yes stop_codon:yes gene_type:complete